MFEANTLGQMHNIIVLDAPVHRISTGLPCLLAGGLERCQEQTRMIDRCLPRTEIRSHRVEQCYNVILSIRRSSTDVLPGTPEDVRSLPGQICGTRPSGGRCAKTSAFTTLDQLLRTLLCFLYLESINSRFTPPPSHRGMWACL